MSSEQLRLALPRAPVLPDGAGAMLVGVPVAAVLGAVAALHPEWWRALLAAALVINLCIVGMKWPRAAVIVTLMWLPFLAFVRRLLIAEDGWVQNDPLILVGPIVALFLCWRIFLVDKREIAPDLLSKLVVILLVIALFGAFSPFGKGGVLGGLAGLIYLAVPLLWFLIGREIGNRRTVSGLFYAVVLVSLPIALYGLYQTEFGSFPQWDVDWFEITGFYGVTAGQSEAGETLFRPWGTFASTSEYSGYLAFAIVFAVAMLYHRRPLLALTIPPIALAVFLAGGRSVMALTLLTIVVLTALRTRNKLFGLVVIVVGVGLTYGAALTLGPSLDRAAGLSSDPKVERQVGGLLNPLDPDKSTFLGHWESLLNAMEDGFRNPAGQGTAASNLGARVSGDEERETDIDIGDVFLSLGFVAGLIFLAIIVLSFRRVFRRYARGRPDPLMLGVAGIMIVNFGQWLQGGHYAASAVMWFMLGWAVKPVRGPDGKVRDTTGQDALAALSRLDPRSLGKKRRETSSRGRSSSQRRRSGSAAR